MVFVNADMIAQQLSGEKGTSADINAGRLLLAQVEELESTRQDFAFETTLASKMLATRVASWQKRGYQVHLIFFWLPSEELACLRVEGRVRDGGHRVPEETIRRRYRSGLKLFFNSYVPIVDTWRLYDNSINAEPKLIARGDATGSCTVLLPDIWNKLTEEFRR